jgi:hypothetical protein
MIKPKVIDCLKNEIEPQFAKIEELIINVSSIIEDIRRSNNQRDEYDDAKTQIEDIMKSIE